MTSLRDRIARAIEPEAFWQDTAEYPHMAQDVIDGRIDLAFEAADAVLAVLDLDKVRAEAWLEGYVKSCADHGDGGRDHGAQNINPYRKAEQ